jgi:hypothetical protein
MPARGSAIDYVTKRLAAQTAAFAPSRGSRPWWRAGDIVRSRARSSQFRAALGAADRRRFGVVDALVRKGKLPAMLGPLRLDWYGFDFARNELAVRDDKGRALALCWALGDDGAGNFFVSRVDGAVQVWDHETGRLEPHTAFSTLDHFFLAMVQLEVIRRAAATIERCDRRPGPTFYLRDTIDALASG